MARYRGSVLKLVRSAGVHLSGFPKSAKLKKSYGPGQHGQARKKLSEYAIQLNEKQKVRRTYGVQEKQFRRIYAEATRRKGVTGTIMLQLLESRADNILFRSGLVVSRPQARQLLAHGHIDVNGKKMDIASYRAFNRFDEEPAITQADLEAAWAREAVSGGPTLMPCSFSSPPRRCR